MGFYNDVVVYISLFVCWNFNFLTSFCFKFKISWISKLNLILKRAFIMMLLSIILFVWLKMIIYCSLSLSLSQKYVFKWSWRIWMVLCKSNPISLLLFWHYSTHFFTFITIILKSRKLNPFSLNSLFLLSLIKRFKLGLS
jgi:hypothetical protein